LLTKYSDMASTSDIRNGMCIDMNGDPYQVMEFLHVKPGKGAAFVRTKLRNLNNGRVLENTFPAGSKLTEVGSRPASTNTSIPTEKPSTS